MNAPDVPSDVTDLLARWRGGDPTALDELLPLVMLELKRIARAYLARERSGNTLQTTALVNEAYLRLAGVRPAEDWKDRARFFAVAARIMRHILVDSARKRLGTKRGGRWQRVDIAEAALISTGGRRPQLVGLDQAIQSLEDFDDRKGRLAELRIFAGLSNEHAAEVLGVSLRTVSREWQFAKAWIARELDLQQPQARPPSKSSPNNTGG